MCVIERFALQPVVFPLFVRIVFINNAKPVNNRKIRLTKLNVYSYNSPLIKIRYRPAYRYIPRLQSQKHETTLNHQRRNLSLPPICINTKNETCENVLLPCFIYFFFQTTATRRFPAFAGSDRERGKSTLARAGFVLHADNPTITRQRV